MQISMNLFGLDAGLYPELATYADQAGLEAVWLSDHLATPARFAATYPYSPSGHPGYGTSTVLHDVWVMIAHLAAGTTRLRFGPGVYILPLRSPFVTALAVATASRLSNGRVMLGVGSGWMREEFEVVGEDFDDRGRRLDEDLDVIAGLLTGDEFEYHGAFFDFGPTAIGGEPVQNLPIVFGGTSRPALRRAAARGDGWFGPVCTLEESRATADCLDELREQGPRGGQPLVHYPRLDGLPTRDVIARYRDAGFEHVVVTGGALIRTATSPAERQEAIAALGQISAQLA